MIADRTREVSHHGMVYALLAPAVERYKAKTEEEQDEGPTLSTIASAYSFLSQVVDFGDVGLDALYLASRARLAPPPSDGGGRQARSAPRPGRQEGGPRC